MIYVYRNPKDVTVSLFHFLRSIKIELTYSGSWNQFVQSFLIDESETNILRGFRHWVVFVVYYAPWWRHLNDYFQIDDRICCVSYEDLLTVS